MRVHTRIGRAGFGLFSLRPMIAMAVLALGLGASPVFADQQTVTFDDTQGHDMDSQLDGQLPSGLIDWGSGDWYLSGPWLNLERNSISFNGDDLSTASFKFVSPHTLMMLDAYNGGEDSSTVTLKCSGQPDKTVQVDAGELLTINTGWSGNTCSTVTISTSNGWYTNFDNLVLQS